MRYLILSDIHGSRPCLEQALAFYRAHHCDMLLLLGDILNYGPRNGVPDGLDAPAIATMLNDMADDIVAIRGNCDSEVDQMLLHFPIMQTTALVVDDGHRILLTHGHVYNADNLPPGHYDLVCTGHTHRWCLAQQKQTWHLNTGSITFPKGGNPPTIAILDHGTLTVYDLTDGAVLQTAQLWR